MSKSWIPQKSLPSSVHTYFFRCISFCFTQEFCWAENQVFNWSQSARSLPDHGTLCEPLVERWYFENRAAMWINHDLKLLPVAPPWRNQRISSNHGPRPGRSLLEGLHGEIRADCSDTNVKSPKFLHIGFVSMIIIDYSCWHMLFDRIHAFALHEVPWSVAHHCETGQMSCSFQNACYGTPTPHTDCKKRILRAHTRCWMI